MNNNDLTRFDFRAAQLAMFAYDDISTLYDDQGLHLYYGRIALIALNPTDPSSFIYPQAFRAELGHNEDGPTIVRTGKVVAEAFMADIMAKGGRVNLLEWDTGPSTAPNDDVVANAQYTAACLPFKNDARLDVTPHDREHTEFELRDTRNNDQLIARLRSFEPDFAAKFARMLASHVDGVA